MYLLFLERCSIKSFPFFLVLVFIFFVLSSASSVIYLFFFPVEKVSKKFLQKNKLYKQDIHSNLSQVYHSNKYIKKNFTFVNSQGHYG